MIFSVSGYFNTAEKSILFLHELSLIEYTYRRKILDKTRHSRIHHCAHRIQPMTHCKSGLITQITVQLYAKFKFLKVDHMLLTSRSCTRTLPECGTTVSWPEQLSPTTPRWNTEKITCQKNSDIVKRKAGATILIGALCS